MLFTVKWREVAVVWGLVYGKTSQKDILDVFTYMSKIDELTKAK